MAKIEVPINELTIWQDHIMTVSQQASVGADGMIAKLDLESVQRAFASDLLKLATDMQKFGHYDSQVRSSSRKMQIAKVLRMKQEHRRGASLVVDFMTKSARFRPNKFQDEHSCVVEAFSPK